MGTSTFPIDFLIIHLSKLASYRSMQACDMAFLSMFCSISLLNIKNRVTNNYFSSNCSIGGLESISMKNKSDFNYSSWNHIHQNLGACRCIYYPFEIFVH
ncbi:hypothetical protein O6H91_10G084000 [Diphasiastrum complanatum]|uniref:Uncharacterized protein n=1 Tax=Diphasiastrum complanatum TaxID=34168 RepID=A0ACC2CIW9_DIPCM|nr:hypothetical protein O6H91_10G084000 [Diphasiastrum complanatum]